jgi:hypothetical protein
MAMAVLNAPSGHADDTTLDPDDWPSATSSRGLADPNSETWIGFEGFRNVWALYSGSTIAPFGSIRESGWRLRASAAVSGYRYTAQWFNPATLRAEPLGVKGRAVSGDILAGYQWRFGRLTVKAFAGAAYVKHELAPAGSALADPADYNTELQGARWGAKVAVETWINVTPHLWASADLALATPHLMTSVRLRSGYRLTTTLSYGAEGGIVGYRDYDYLHEKRVIARTAKVGGFVRYDSGLNEISVSGGWQVPRHGEGSPYVTVQWLTRF